MKQILKNTMAWGTAALFLFTCFTANAQFDEVPVSAGSYTGCNAVILDTGLNPGYYSDNENFTITVCPGDGEETLHIYWSIFNLGSGDSMTIYDGDDVGDPLIGVFTGDELQYLNSQPSEDNTTGCLTMTFVSDGNEVGNFAGNLLCGDPCVRPIVEVTSLSESPVLVCPGDEVPFDASNTIVGDGATIVSWEWDWGDGTSEIITDGPTASHVYPETGGFVVALKAIDDNGCESANAIDLHVYTATDPDWTGTSPEQIVCFAEGSTVDLTGVVNGVNFTNVPDVDFGGFLFIPDVQGQCFESSITFEGFGNQTITQQSDIENLFINFEHSYMGDLVITIFCPNGSPMTLHQQGGGGTYLGEPIDDGSDVPGVGYDYFWAWDATNGTWQEESVNFGTLPSDTYSAVGDWNDLVGCPVNGDWTIEICDNFAIDNGFIFDWGLNLAPTFFPDTIDFTPTFGALCDSTFWQGAGIVDESDDCNTISVTPPNPGLNEYTFVATNNHGCTYETTVNVFAVEPNDINVEEEVYFCGTNLTIPAEMVDPIPGQAYSYQWDDPSLFANPNAQNGVITNVDQDTTIVTVSAYPNILPDCIGSAEVAVIVPPALEMPDPTTYEGCLGFGFDVAAPVQPFEGDFTYAWYPLDDPDNILETDAFYTFEEEGEYGLTITQSAPCPSSATTSFIIELIACELGEIPNVFSPNGDITNDAFDIEGIEFFPGSSLQVYNRWGTLIYESEDYKGNWSPSQDEVAEGTYYFILNVNFPEGVETYTGEVTILRK